MTLLQKVEQETEEEIRQRLAGLNTNLRTPKPKSLQIAKFYARYGFDWIQRFYRDNISINSLPHDDGY